MPLRTLIWMGLTASLLVGSGCASRYSFLTLTPVEPGAEGRVRPAAMPAAAEVLAGCAGVQLNESLIHLACDDAQEIYAARYAAEVEACRAIAKGVYSRARLAGGPTFRLPAPAQTFHAEIDYATGLGSVAAVVACTPAAEGGMLFLTALGAPHLDSTFYTQALPALAYDGVPAPIVHSRHPATLDFFRRALPVPASCTLMGARNLSCYPLGQMDWSKFSTLADARASAVRRVQASAVAGATIVDDENAPCTFEGVATTCRRVSYRLPVAKSLALGTSNVLIAYYVAADVRGVHAQAVCSFYEDQAPEGGLAALCADVIGLAPPRTSHDDDP